MINTFSLFYWAHVYETSPLLSSKVTITYADYTLAVVYYVTYWLPRVKRESQWDLPFCSDSFGKQSHTLWALISLTKRMVKKWVLSNFFNHIYFTFLLEIKTNTFLFSIRSVTVVLNYLTYKSYHFTLQLMLLKRQLILPEWFQLYN